MLNCTNLL